MRARIALVFGTMLAATGAGFCVGRTVSAQADEGTWKPQRVSTAALPKTWGHVRAAVGRDEITLILEDDAGTVRAVTLERGLSADGNTPAVIPRLFTVVARQ